MVRRSRSGLPHQISRTAVPACANAPTEAKAEAAAVPISSPPNSRRLKLRVIMVLPKDRAKARWHTRALAGPFNSRK